MSVPIPDWEVWQEEGTAWAWVPLISRHGCPDSCSLLTVPLSGSLTQSFPLVPKPGSALLSPGLPKNRELLLPRQSPEKTSQPWGAAFLHRSPTELPQTRNKPCQPSWLLAAEVEVAGVRSQPLPMVALTPQPTLCCPGLPTRPAPQEPRHLAAHRSGGELNDSRTPGDTGTRANRANPPHLHSLRWRPSGPSSPSGAAPACSAGPLSSSAAPPLWTVTAWRLLPPGSCRTCTGQHLHKEHRESARPERSGCQGLRLSGSSVYRRAAPGWSCGEGEARGLPASHPLTLRSAHLQMERNTGGSLQGSSPQLSDDCH